MNQHIENILQGMANLWVTPQRDYIHPTGGGFKQDAIAMRGDFKAIGNDMRKALKNEQTKAH